RRGRSRGMSLSGKGSLTPQPAFLQQCCEARARLADLSRSLSQIEFRTEDNELIAEARRSTSIVRLTGDTAKNYAEHQKMPEMAHGSTCWPKAVLPEFK
ncbi:hypothetical protein, partial [Sagittula salina]